MTDDNNNTHPFRSLGKEVKTAMVTRQIYPTLQEVQQMNQIRTHAASILQLLPRHVPESKKDLIPYTLY